MKLTETAFKGFKLGEQSATETGREFICMAMRNILAMNDLVEIHDYCERMIDVNTITDDMNKKKRDERTALSVKPWWLMSDGELKIEDAKFALRCAEEFKRRLIFPKSTNGG